MEVSIETSMPNSTCIHIALFCLTTYAQQKEKEEKKNRQIACLLWGNGIHTMISFPISHSEVNNGISL